VIPCVPTASALVAHCAVRLLPDPVSVIAEQLLIEFTPSLKFTVPVGDTPLTVALKVTVVPAVEGVSEVTTLVALAALLTVCDSVALLETAFVASPLYLATMLRTPAARALVVHVAVRVLPVPVNPTAEQPLIELLPSLKLTVPVGDAPLTVAVKVTLAPTVDGVSEVTMLVVLIALLIVCESDELVEAVFEASPAYAATMLCAPMASALVVHAAVRVLPAPVKATAAQPLIELPPSVKLTLPVGLKPVTEAVKVRGAANAAGLTELERVVVLVALLTTCDSAPLVDAAFVASPP
jgi:hypothetical protein